MSPVQKLRKSVEDFHSRFRLRGDSSEEHVRFLRFLDLLEERGDVSVRVDPLPNYQDALPFLWGTSDTSGLSAALSMLGAIQRDYNALKQAMETRRVKRQQEAAIDFGFFKRSLQRRGVTTR